MTSRERVLRTMNFQPVDCPAVQYLYTPVGYYEHGEKLNALFAAHEGDFSPYHPWEIPSPPSSAINAQGEYYERKTDEWGSVYEYRVFGIMGHILKPAIPTTEDYQRYRFPAYPPITLEDVRQAKLHKKTHYLMQGGNFSYLERLTGLRNFENALVDLMEDSAELNAFLDRLTDYYLERVYELLKLDVDSICFGDDYGTQQNLILSRELFQHAIKPRLNRLMEPIRKAGKTILFHSCGKISELFDDFKDLGVNAIWPQLPVYDMAELAAMCKAYRFCCAIHTDRAETMTHGTPEQVKELVEKEFEIFRPDQGGSWFYIEVDTGFPFSNIEALVHTIYGFR